MRSRWAGCQGGLRLDFQIDRHYLKTYCCFTMGVIAMADFNEAYAGGAVLALAGDEPDAEEVPNDPLIRAWVLHQLVASASTVNAVLSEGDKP